jgi:hypothetical protein
MKYMLACLLLFLVGCSNAATSDKVRVGYGPAVTRQTQGPTIIEGRGEFDVVARPDGSVSFTQSPKPTNQGGGK